MFDMSMIIAHNIMSLLKKQNKKQTDMADGIGTTKQTVNKMLNGSRMINAIELKKIADYLGVKMDELTKLPDVIQEENVVPVFMGKVASQQAREAVTLADKLSDMILFHSRVRENGVQMMKDWGDDS
ncbi:MAG: helix-turn-helix transcriptional regulator [Lachnospiraceae bacterium]|nr:helix-turn-helix transcriptional regulator [Lachnospiraceae bacterium]